MSFRMDWLDLLAVQGTLKSLLQHHSSKWAKELNRFNSSALSFFHSPTLTSIHDHRKNHSQCIYMEFRKIVMITLYARQQKRHRYIEWSFGLCGRWWGRDDIREWHWNMYVIICETDRQSWFDAWDRVLRAGVLGWPRGMGWGRRWEGGSGCGNMYTHAWLMWMYGKNHCNIVK